MSHFTPIPALIGGALIGISASLLLLTNGKIAGVSNVLAGLLLRRERGPSYRSAFLVGLFVAGGLLLWRAPEVFGTPAVGLPATLIAGVLVGAGTRLGNGCTSGHGVCGISRLSVRSMVATVVFMFTGAVTVFAMRSLSVGP